MQPFGQYLKSEREKRGIRLEEIASSTKIHIQNLSLMEEDRWKELPQEPFIRGFISAYARYLGLDNKETLKKFSESQSSPENISQENIEASSFNVTTTKESESLNAQTQHSPQLKKFNLNSSVQIKAVVVAAVLLIVTVIVMGRRSEQTSTLEVTSTTLEQPALVTDSTLPGSISAATDTTLKTEAETTTTQMAPTSTVTVPTTPVVSVPAVAPTPTTIVSVVPTTQKTSTVVETSTTKPTSTEPKVEPIPVEGHELQVNVKYRTWTKVVIDDSPATETYLEAGSKTSYEAKNKIKLVLGNSTGSEVTHNGEVVTGKKFSGTIRFYIFPKGSRFPQDKPKVKNSDETNSENEESTAPSKENVE
jgi:cytoskeletal protein RodZ